MKSYKMWINGQWVDAESGKTYTIVNPTTEETIARVPLGDKTDVDKAVNAARKAFPLWAKKSQADRSKIASKIAAAIMEHLQELVELEILEHGTPRSYAHLVVSAAANYFDWAAYAAKSLTGEVLPVDPGKKVYLQREPVGVNALITPWNLPLAVAATKLSQALTVGNACIIKPPSVNSIEVLKLAEILEKLELPPGVVNVVTGPGSVVGEALASHPGVDLVGFTGSSETGKRIMSLASSTVKRVQLELGGKNPIIVMPDVKVSTVVLRMVMTQFFNAGQICASPGRYYVHEKIHDEFVNTFAELTKSIIVGDPNDNNTQLGPVVSREHRDSIEKYIKSGIEEGAKLVLGGKRPTNAPLNKGFFVMPTIFSNVKQNMIIGREEIFGPVVCIMEKFSSEDEVLELANDSIYGLCATIWSGDTAKAMKFADKLSSGSVWINTEGLLKPEMPWGGYKESGIGKDGSRFGLEEYTRIKAITVRL